MTTSFEKTDKELLDYQHDLLDYISDGVIEDIQYAKDMEFLDAIDDAIEAAIEAQTGKRPRREPRPPRERPEFVPTPTYRFPDLSQI
jgi:hypothetical protein